MALELVSDAGAVEPLSLWLVRTQAKIGVAGGPEDDFIDGVAIPAVRQRCELQTGRQLRLVTYDLALDGFPCDRYIEIPRPPLVDVPSVSYTDTAGVTQTLVEGTDYSVSLPTGERPKRGRVVLLEGISWPSTRVQADAVRVRFQCGYATAADVPAILKAAMLMDATSLIANPENLSVGAAVTEIPGGARSIYWSWKSHATQLLPEGVR